MAEKSRRFAERNPDYAERNRARINAASRKYNAENRAKRADLRAKHRAIRLRAVPKWFSVDDALRIARTRRLAEFMTEITGTPWEVDHIIPLAGRNVCGLHVGSNVQAAPRSINRRKSNKFSPDFLEDIV